MDATDVYVVEPVASFASSVDGTVRLVLHLPEAPPVDGPVTVVLRTGQRTVRAAATVTLDPGATGGALVEGTVPAARLGKGTWRLSLRSGQDGPPVRLQARLVTGPRLPVALVTGPAARTRMPAPTPRRRPGTRPGRPAASRGWRAATKAVDTALSPLPDEQAARLRSVLATAARRARPRS
jgi:hypothetical protein